MQQMERMPRAGGLPLVPEGLTVERMSAEDVPAVMAVDHLCFPTPWSENAYRSELGNVSAYYLVARVPAPTPAFGRSTHSVGIRLRGNPTPNVGEGAGKAAGPGRVIGFAGAWIVMDEAHITTLGVHPEFRRHGVGERLLVALLEEARARGVRRATLEVRENNRGAQALYARFGFAPIARRRRYYSDTDEDAIVMWVEGLQAGIQVFRYSGIQATGTADTEDCETRTPEYLNT